MHEGEYKLLIQLDMEELFLGKTLTTFGYLKLKGDILAQGRGHTVCMTMSLQQGQNPLGTAPH